MQIVVVGLDHHLNPVEVRERFAFRSSDLPRAFERLLREADTPVREAAILSTCNRVEIYAVAPNAEDAYTALSSFLIAFHGIAPDDQQPELYFLADGKAVEHLFSTTCGLNSMVVGENQIQAQVREAAAVAASLQALGSTLNALFRHAVEVGKRARTETAVSRYAASTSHAGVELARRHLGGLNSADVLLVGSGKVSELAAKNLLDNGARSITLVNRTVESAQQLADRWGGRALPFEALPKALEDADVVLSSTAAPHPIIHRHHVETALARRSNRPLLLIDLAVPRDIDPEVAGLAGVHVYDIDDLDQVVASNLRRRRDELGSVQGIVDEETARFMQWLHSRSVMPTLNQLRGMAEGIGRTELDRAFRRLGGLDQREREVVEALAMAIVNKLLHQPTIRLKQEAAQGNGAEYAEALQVLFGLDGGSHAV
ncbi:MAG TPA: glutamyl-tRNA reductase [Herpetosiphonaceae bacterium]|nr:glutamyl-tRNA reductase [Herpetosiphonaceae bacterium]